MLVETFDYALTNREKILSQIDFTEHEAIVEEAKTRWTDFEPVTEPIDIELAGVDSSWNFIPYQGFYIYAVDAVAMRSDGSCLVPPLFDVNLSTLAVQVGDDDDGAWVSRPSLALESIGMEYEYEQAQASIGKTDLVLVDGSILARFYDRKRGKESAFYDYARELMKERDKILFISKSSYSNTALSGSFGDMFYYNRVSSKPGYSDPYLDHRSGVTVCYVRLTEDSPSIRLEMPGEINSREIEELMGGLRSASMDGYPYVLRLAHERGKISHDEMEKLAKLLGLNTQIGGRQVLGE